ncbi:GerMN domain-containing protein [Geomonas sp.]|uniref:GerMN domain-containing protein n=1 Tax=Geomonas sp. TaxID=2651584 RepID=UPI002B4A1ED2|nr:GerMN domain-containing protein [Geomonas sp.]HJV36874.1 GerMN domain-containing protein [Geomonas sp.]
MKKRRTQAKYLLLASFLLFAVVLGALIFRKYHTASGPLEPSPTTAQQGTTVVTLFFGSPDGKGLVREGREVEIEEGLEESIETVMDELVSGPIGSSAPTIPANTRVLGVKVIGNVAHIDFGSELKEGTPPGSAAETAAVYSIVDTVTTNFPQIKSVQILIEGAPAETLQGHLDLKEPLPPDFTLEGKKAEQAETPAPSQK